MSKQSYSKAKGREAENAVVKYLRKRGIAAERRRLTGVEDCGDISGWGGVVCEVKAEKKLALAGYVDELQVEVKNADKRFRAKHQGLVVAKRRGKTNPAEWYAIMPMHQAVELLQFQSKLKERVELASALGELRARLQLGEAGASVRLDKGDHSTQYFGEREPGWDANGSPA